MVAAASPNLANAQAWTAVLDGAHATPANDSRATGALTLSLAGTTLTGMLNWSDLERSPGGARVVVGSSRIPALAFQRFPARQSGNYSERFDLASASTFAPEFLRAHGGKLDEARSALLAALDAGEAKAEFPSQNATRPAEIAGQLEASRSASRHR